MWLIFFGACWLWGTGQVRYPNKPAPSFSRYNRIRLGLFVCGFLSLPVPPSCLVPEKNHTEISISYNADWPIRSGYLLANSYILINPFIWSILAMRLSTFFSGAAHILLLWWSAQEWEESTSFSPEFSCSLCIISTSCLFFPPIPPAWPISIYLKHDWQNTDNSPAPLPPLFLKNKGK